jgi:sigma-E factor negative regulatory protein RseB
VLAWAAATAARAEEPTHWLQRMNHALTTSSYEGTFVHWQGGKVELLRIIHRVHDGAVSERLVSLDGSGREYIRIGTQLTCYLPDKRRVIVQQRSPENPLIGIPQITHQTASFYDIQETARVRVNRRHTHLITVSPKDGFRYGYRLWIDDATGMPLKTQLCDSQGHTIEQIVFASFTPGARITDSEFKPEVATEGFQWERGDAPPDTHPVALEHTLATTLKLPPGFKLMAHSTQVLAGLADPVDHMVFTDGLASVSVFIEQSASGPGTTEMVESHVGSSSAFSLATDGRKITAVGEVPSVTVRYIASSVLNQEAPAPPQFQTQSVQAVHHAPPVQPVQQTATTPR